MSQSAPFEISDEVLDELKAFLIAKGLWFRDEEVPDSSRLMLREVLPWLMDAVLHRRRLSALEIQLFQLTDAALFEIAQGFNMDEEELRKFKYRDRAERVQRIYEGFESDLPALNELVVAYAGRRTVKQYGAKGLESVEQVAEALEKVQQNMADHPSAYSRRPKVAMTHTLEDGRLAVTYAVTQKGREIVDSDGRPTQILKQRTVTLLVDPETQRIEARGTTGDTDRAIKAFRTDMQGQGVKADYPEVKISEPQMHKLFQRLGAKVIRERVEDPYGHVGGIGTREYALHPGFQGEVVDLRYTPDYQALPTDLRKCGWLASFRHTDGVSYSFRVNLLKSSISWLAGRTNDKVVSIVHSTLAAIKEEHDG